MVFRHFLHNEDYRAPSTVVRHNSGHQAAQLPVENVRHGLGIERQLGILELEEEGGRGPVE